jgi:hypothetical protein
MAQHTINDTAEKVVARVLRSGWFFGLVAAAFIGLLVLASWPWWFSRFALTATTRTVEISASAPKVHEIAAKLPKGGEMQIFSARADDLPPELLGLAANPVSVRLAASSAILQSISLPSGSGLIVRATPEAGADIGVLNEGSMSVALAGTIERIDETGRRTTIANIGRATVWEIRPAERNSPARLVLPDGLAPIALYNQPITDFWFRSPRPVGDDPRAFQSEMLKGELQLLDTGVKIELRPRELILLQGGSRFMSKLELIDRAVSVDVSGEADRISVGPARPGDSLRLDRDLTPSVLSYLLGQHELKLLWGAVLALLGGFWKARQWALKLKR